jgi:hypothetical protein
MNKWKLDYKIIEIVYEKNPLKNKERKKVVFLLVVTINPKRYLVLFSYLFFCDTDLHI